MVSISGVRGVKEIEILFAQRHGSKAMGAESCSLQYIDSRINVKTVPTVIGSVFWVFDIEMMRWFK